MTRRRFAAGGATGASRQLLLIANLCAPPFRGPILVALSALALSSMLDIHAALPLLCGDAGEHLPFATVAASARFLIAANPPATLLLAWLVMLVAMMTPLIALPLAHVRAASLTERAWRAAAAFLLGYFGVWVLAAVPVLALAFALRLLAGGIPVALLGACILATVWSACPVSQAAQNRAHRLRRIGLFGLAADLDCLLFGARLGGWCLLSCWAWMLVPLFASTGHIAAMLAVAMIVMAERLQGPGTPRWRVPVLPSAALSGARALVVSAHRHA